MEVQTHNLVTGDVAKYQQLLKEKGLYGKVVGEKPVLQTIPLDKVVEIEAQRDTQSKWAYDRIVDRGGFDEGVGQPIMVTYDEEKDEYPCFNGLGTTCLRQLMGFTHIDAWVYKATTREAAERFSYINKRGIRTVKPESIFSADVYAENDSALKEVEVLKQIRLCVKVRNNKVLPEGSKDPQINISALRKALDFAGGDISVLKMARDCIVNAYPDDHVIRQGLFVGKVIVFTNYPVLQRPGAPYDQITKFLESYGAMMEQVKLPFKKDGGNQHNAEYESTAYGIVKNFTQSKFCSTETAKHVRHKVILQRYDLEKVSQ